MIKRSVAIVILVSFSAVCDASSESNAKSMKDSFSQKDVQPATCVETQLCIVGDQWDPQQCKCVKTCVDNIFCIIGGHWDPDACKCVKDCPAHGKHCPEKHHWNPQSCKCIKNCDTVMVDCLNGGTWNTVLCKCVK